MSIEQQWYKGLDYYTGENPENWHRQMRQAAWSQGFSSEQELGQKLDEYSLKKINDLEKAESLAKTIICETGWSVTEDNWHGFIGRLMLRSNHKIDGKLASKVLRKIAEDSFKQVDER